MTTLRAGLGAVALAAGVAAQPAATAQSSPQPSATAKPRTGAQDQPARKPESVKALLQLARQQADKKDAEGALETLRKARRLAPNSEEVLHAFAETALAVHAPLVALPALEALTRICPSVSQYHYLLGMALVQAGDTAAAVDPLKMAGRLDPDEPPVLTALATALNERKLYTEAKPLLLHALSLAPDSVEAMAALAEAEAGLSELAEAEGHAQRALARQADNATASRVLGTVRMQQERYPEACDALLKALASDPSSAKTHYQLSLVYRRLGDEAAAEKHVALYRQRAAEAESRIKEVRALTGFSSGGMQK